MKGCHKLGHIRHGDFACDDRADNAANDDASSNDAKRDRIKLTAREQYSKRGAHRDGHADHAIAVARAAGGRAGKSAQGKDEKNPGDEV